MSGNSARSVNLWVIYRARFERPPLANCLWLGISVAMDYRIAILLLAAGASRRMRGRDKLLEKIDGTPLLRRVADAACASAARDVVVVLGARAEARAKALAGLPIQTTQNPDWESGMASSIRSGITALDPAVEAALILLGDMPDVDVSLIDRVLGGFDPQNGIDIVRPVSASGPVGNPVLFGRRHFPALQALSGDAGAKSVIAANRDSVLDLPTADDRSLVDLDTPEAWAAWRARQ